MTESAKGVLALVLACTVWGLSPVFYIELSHLPPLTVLAWRTVWSCVFLLGLLALQGRLGAVRGAFETRGRIWVTLVAALLVSGNWFGFIFAVTSGQTVESSLGYFMFPLVAVALGRIVLGERLAGLQWLAVGLGALAVAVLTYGLGAAPWIGLWLAVTFGLYGLVKVRLPLGPVVSVAAEVVLLAPLALGWILMVGPPGDWRTHLLLALSGVLTGGPLALFAYAARRVRLSTLGIGQYINPSLQIVIAVLWFAEPFTLWHAIAFPMIWAGLVIYSGSTLAQERASRRLDSSAATSATVVAKP